jgi:hypothetical protein
LQHKREQGYVPGALKRNCQAALVLQAATGTLAAFDFAVAVQVTLQQLYVFVIDSVSLFGTKPTDFLTVKISH